MPANEPKIFPGQDGQPSGILGDLLVEIARLENWRLKPLACEWEACMQALREGRIDLLPDMAYSEERARLFDFHRHPVLHSWSQIYRHDGVKIESMLDLQGKRVGVLAGSLQQQYLADLLPNFGVKAELVPVSSLEEAFRLAAARQLDALAANRFSGNLLSPRFRLRETPLIFLPTQLHYATARGHNAQLLAAIDRHLGQWQNRQHSFYFQTLDRWSGMTGSGKIPAWLGWGLGILAGLLVLAFAGMALLRRQVAEKTHLLQASETRLNTILDSVEAYIYLKDPDYRYQYANRKVCDLLGHPAAEVIGRTDQEFFDASTFAMLRENDRRVLEHGEQIEIEENNRLIGAQEVRVFLSTKLPLRRPDGQVYALCGVSTDITRQKQAEQAIQQLAFYDPLTQLPNRRLLQDRLQQALAAIARRPQGGALFFIDLDNFKVLNDTLGHDQGDQLLVQMAARLRASLRQEDTLARLGGDEFVVMLQGLHTDPDQAVWQARRVAEKIQAALAHPYELAGQQYQSSVSIGIAMFSDPHLTREDLLKRADLAVYQAKADGRNTLRFFNPEMQARATEHAATEAALRAVLDQNSAQFLLHYQPQVDSAGLTVGMEALVRWQHPEQGLLGPGRFIPVAESTGLMLPLGEWILRTACQQLAKWAGNPDTARRHMAVNVSVVQLRHPEFVDRVLDIIGQTGANPRLLKLELTESQLIHDMDRVIGKMEFLKEQGIQFVLDDFGTGYSSLSVLKHLPLDQLKIDRSFIRDLLTDPNDAAIVKTIIMLGEILGLGVIAEGVETQEQASMLQQLGCRYFQGYLFGRPAPPEMPY